MSRMRWIRMNLLKTNSIRKMITMNHLNQVIRRKVKALRTQKNQQVKMVVSCMQPLQGTRVLLIPKIGYMQSLRQFRLVAL